MMAPRIIIQRVRCTWTKASRGGEAARIRNSLPRQLMLPLEAFAAPVTLHRVEFSEPSNFKSQEIVQRFAELAEVQLIDLSLRVIGEKLEAKHLRRADNAAIRHRPYPFLGGVHIADGEWAELRANGRYVDYHTGNWWYDSTTYNVGLFSELATDRFIQSKAAKRYADLARL
jgi:hypothetical protein